MRPQDDGAGRVQGFQHLKLAGLGLHKGSSPATDENIRLVQNKAPNFSREVIL